MAFKFDYLQCSGEKPTYYNYQKKKFENYINGWNWHLTFFSGSLLGGDFELISGSKALLKTNAATMRKFTFSIRVVEGST